MDYPWPGSLTRCSNAHRGQRLLELSRWRASGIAASGRDAHGSGTDSSEDECGQGQREVKRDASSGVPPWYRTSIDSFDPLLMQQVPADVSGEASSRPRGGRQQAGDRDRDGDGSPYGFEHNAGWRRSINAKPVYSAAIPTKSVAKAGLCHVYGSKATIAMDTAASAAPPTNAGSVAAVCHHLLWPQLRPIAYAARPDTAMLIA
jgi:hypothetical protein